MCAKIRGQNTGRNLATRKMRSRRSMGLCKKVHKLQNKDKATFYSPTEAWVMLAPSSKKQARRTRICGRFRSIHAHVELKKLSSHELDTLRKSKKNPTTVETDSGEVQTNEEAKVHVRDLDIFVTVQLLEDTPAVLSLGKLCEDHGYS